MLEKNKNLAIFIENYIAGGSDKIARDLIDNLKYEKLFLFVNANNDFSVLLAKTLPDNCELIKYNLFTIANLGKIANNFKKKSKLVYLFLKIVNLLIRYPLMFFYIIYFYFLFKKFEIDVFFSNNGGYPGGECNRMATISAIFLKYKNFHIIHSLATKPFFKPFILMEYIIDKFIAKSSTLICVSKQTKEYLLKNRFINKNILTIYNGVKSTNENFKKFKNNNKIKLLNIGAIGDLKNQVMLIKAMNLLKAKDYDLVELHIVGKEEDEGYLDFLQEKIANYKLDNIFFHGFTKNPYFYYGECDIFLLSSKVESFALVRVEAMSVGMPVITTDIGDADKQVITNKNGYIVNDYHEMASAIEKYILNRELIELHAKNGFDLYTKNFTIDKMIDNYQKLIDGE